MNLNLRYSPQINKLCSFDRGQKSSFLGVQKLVHCTKISGCERIYESFLFELIAELFLSSSATGIIQWLDLLGVLGVVVLSYRIRVLRSVTASPVRFLQEPGDVPESLR